VQPHGWTFRAGGQRRDQHGTEHGRAARHAPRPAVRHEVAQGRRPWHNALITERAARFHLAHGLESVLTYEGTHEIHLLAVGQALTGRSAYR
jgi:hypothetical protein